MIYNRQLYKQQMASIGLQGKNERRYYTGVQGQKGQEGELFGAANLLKLVTDTSITEGKDVLFPSYAVDIIKETEKAEKELYRIEQYQGEEEPVEKTDMNSLFNE